MRVRGNLYGYGGGDPVNRIDPSGLDWLLTSVCTVGNVLNGFYDGLTPGGTRKLRQWLGTDDYTYTYTYTYTDSAAYRGGDAASGEIWTHLSDRCAAEVTA